MFSFIKKKKVKKKLSPIVDILISFYLAPFDFRIPFDTLSDNLKIKIMLFTYGVVDNYVQASKLSDSEVDRIFEEVDVFTKNTMNVSFLKFLKSQDYIKSFENASLLEIIKLGGKTYSDFASKKHATAVLVLSSFIAIWQENERCEIEKMQRKEA